MHDFLILAHIRPTNEQLQQFSCEGVIVTPYSCPQSFPRVLCNFLFVFFVFSYSCVRIPVAAWIRWCTFRPAAVVHSQVLRLFVEV